MFLSFAESCDPLNSFNWWEEGGQSYNSTLNVCQADFYRSRIMCSEKTPGELWGFGLFFFFFSFSILSFWTLVPVAHVFMVGWFCLTFSPLFNGLRDSWSKNCLEIAKVSKRRDWIIQNIFLHLTFELQGSTHSFCSASYFMFYFFIPPNVSYVFFDFAPNHGSELKLIRDFTIISKSRHRLHVMWEIVKVFSQTLVTY